MFEKCIESMSDFALYSRHLKFGYQFLSNSICVANLLLPVHTTTATVVIVGDLEPLPTSRSCLCSAGNLVFNEKYIKKRSCNEVWAGQIL